MLIPELVSVEALIPSAPRAPTPLNPNFNSCFSSPEALEQRKALEMPTVPLTWGETFSKSLCQHTVHKQDRRASGDRAREPGRTFSMHEVTGRAKHLRNKVLTWAARFTETPQLPQRKCQASTQGFVASNSNICFPQEMTKGTGTASLRACLGNHVAS